MKTPSNEELFQFLKGLRSNPKAIAGIAIAFFVLDVSFLLRGQFSQIGRAMSEARKLKTEYATASSDIKLAATYQKRLNELNGEETGLEAQIPPEGNMPNILEAISKFADMSSVKILRIGPVADARTASVADKTGELKVVRQKISLTARCGFHQLGRFVALLENAPQFFDIKSLEIRVDDQDLMRQIVTMLVEVAVRKG